jgi:YVTN family beta-propeller protein
MRRISLAFALAILLLGVAAAPRHLQSHTASSPDFVHFESSHVHPACLTPSGDRLLVVNSPDGYLTVFDISPADSTPTRSAEIPVGLEPVSVAALDDSTAWVVNSLSDDISVVNLNTMNVRATLRVGDEPADVVFAGTPTRAYVSVSEEDAVKVYDPADLAAAPEVIAIPGSMPRSLAKTADGSKVYVALFQSGNHTTILGPKKLPADSMPADFDMPPDAGLPPAPHAGVIVQSQGSNWYDMYGNLWNSHIKYQVRESDVVEIATATNTLPRTFGGIVSTVMGVAVSPIDSRIAYVGTEARNILRYEPRITGYTVETNIGFVNYVTGLVALRKLDPHIDFDTTPGTQAEADSALGIPTGVSFSSNGQRAYVTSFATAKIGVLNPSGGPSSTVLARVKCVAGPTQVVVDDAHRRLYVVGRFHNELQTLRSETLKEINRQRIGYDPTPDAIVNGRRLFYGGFTSSHGDQSCASCHIFGDSDHLAWDLGDPFGSVVPPPPGNPDGLLGTHPLKGPLVTQSLRGLTNTEPFHWRGDRTNFLAFKNAILSLMGRATPLADSEMTAMGDFVMPMVYPPNPRENLDRTLPDAPLGEGSAVRGQAFFTGTVVDSGMVCADCHTAAGFGPGTDRLMVRAVHLGASQDMKVPQLRNLLRKTGFTDAPGAINKRGFGYTPDGSADNLATFDHGPGFSYGPDAGTIADNRRDLTAYLSAFDSGIAPSVGRQITFDGTNNENPAEIATLDTLRDQATATNCDLVAHGRSGGQARGWLYVGVDQWQPDKVAEPNLSTANLVALAGLGTELTVTGVPVGSGIRTALDRDRDTYLNGDELDAGSDPGNPAGNPTNAGVPSGGAALATGLGVIGPNPFRSTTDVHFTLGRRGPIDLVVYDVLGREVRAMAHGQEFAAGRQSLRWDGRDNGGREVGAGVYFVRMKIESGQWSKPVVHIR